MKKAYDTLEDIITIVLTVGAIILAYSVIKNPDATFDFLYRVLR